MAQPQGSDKLIIQRNTSYFTLDFQTVLDSFEIPNAKQGNAITGRAGKMFPTDDFDYDEVTGELGITFPRSLNFIGKLENDYQTPEARLFNSGDFYLVSPDPATNQDNKIVLYVKDWTGVDGQDYHTVQLKAGGTVYKGDTGVVSNFGEGKETTVYNHTSPTTGVGLLLDFNLDRGSIEVKSVKIVNGGIGYGIGDILELRQLVPRLFASVFLKVTNVDQNGTINAFDIIKGGDIGEPEFDEDPIDPAVDKVGLYYLVPYDNESYAYQIATEGRNALVTGRNLFVDIVCQYGGIKSATISPNSGHVGFKDGQEVFVFSLVSGLFSDGRLEVNISPNNTNTFTAYENDKLIYSEQTVAGITKAQWVHIKDSVSANTITSISVPVKPYTDPEYTNAHKSVITNRNVTDSNVYDISVKDAHYEINSSGFINQGTSYSGLLTPEEKQKLDQLPYIIGTVTNIITNTNINQYNGSEYKPLVLDDDEGTYVISLAPAGVGEMGITSIGDDTDIFEKVIQRHANNPDAGKGDVSVVPNIGQTARFFLPNNFYLLPEMS